MDLGDRAARLEPPRTGPAVDPFGVLGAVGTRDALEERRAELQSHAVDHTTDGTAPPNTRKGGRVPAGRAGRVRQADQDRSQMVCGDAASAATASSVSASAVSVTTYPCSARVARYWPGHVGAVLGQALVELGEHARHVDVEEPDPRARGQCRGEDGRHVDRQLGAALEGEPGELAGHEPADLLLRLLGRAADVRGEDDVVETAQRRLERVALRLRLDREHVHRRTGDVAGLDVLAQRLGVDHHAARGVDEQRARLHRRELLRPEEAGVAGPAVDVQRDHVGLGQQLVEGVHPTGVAVGEPVGGVEEDDPQPERLGDVGELGADVAVPDDAERAAADLVAAGRRLVPDARVHLQRLLRQPPRQRDDLADDELDDAARVGVRRVEDRDAPLRGRGEVDLVGADAEAADRQQVRRPVEHRLGDRRVGADAEQRDPRAAPPAGRPRSSRPCAARPRTRPSRGTRRPGGGCSRAGVPSRDQRREAARSARVGVHAVGGPGGLGPGGLVLGVGVVGGWVCVRGLLGLPGSPPGGQGRRVAATAFAVVALRWRRRGQAL